MLFNVTLKPQASPKELDKAKEEAKKNGGMIRHEYSLIKGFTVEYPEDHIRVLKSNEYVNVEQDGGVTTR